MECSFIPLKHAHDSVKGGAGGFTNSGRGQLGSLKLLHEVIHSLLARVALSRACLLGVHDHEGLLNFHRAGQTLKSHTHRRSDHLPLRREQPSPGSLSTVIVPPCLSTTSERAMANPWPVPFPTSLVVKNGSKIFDRIDSGMPPPVSAIRISADSPTHSLDTVMMPFAPDLLTTLAMAWAAFTMMFSMT